jgi:bifunctional UDP-N-acetylglucosamine pyrophosphorylase/glucosamine-1-phosphate N-acetyltransferase
MKLQAVVLAGGIGKRIAPLGLNKPKSMFAVAGKPLIVHTLEAVRSSGLIDEATIVIAPGENAIQEALGQGEGLGLKLRYAVQEKPLGQANALLSARAQVAGSFLVLNANDVFDPELIGRLAHTGMDGGLDVGLTGRVVDEPSKFGVMAFDAGQRLVGVVEKPPPDQAPSSVAVIGLYYFSPRIWEALDATPLGESDDQFERAYQKLISAGGGGYLLYEGPFASYKFAWDLLTLNDILLGRLAAASIHPTAQVSPHAVLDGSVVLDEGVRVFENAVVRGPAYIGKHSIIGNGALVRGGVSLGESCVVGYDTEISHSILGDHCWTHKNFIGDSIISDNCSFGAGTITANLRFDERPVKVRVGESRLSSGMSHFGIIMAEDCRTGCNAVLLPGVRIGPNSAVGPGVVLSDDLPPGKAAYLSSTAYEVRDNQIDIHQLSRAERMKFLRKS